MNNFTSPTLINLAQSLFGSMDPKQQVAVLKGMKTPIPGMLNESKDALLANADLGKSLTGGDSPVGISLGQLGALGRGAASSHPFKTAGLVGLGLGNIGGLTDGNGIGGQLGGLALGGLGSYMLGVSPYTAAMLTLGGGELGSLFDKLRSKNDQQSQMQQYRR